MRVVTAVPKMGGGEAVTRPRAAPVLPFAELVFGRGFGGAPGRDRAQLLCVLS